MEEIHGHHSRGTIYLYKEYLYLKRGKKYSKVYFQCRTRGCSAGLIFNTKNPKEIKCTKQHCHGRDEKEIQHLRFKEELRLAAANSDEKYRQLYEQIALRYPQASMQYKYPAALLTMVRARKSSKNMSEKIKSETSDTIEVLISSEDWESHTETIENCEIEESPVKANILDKSEGKKMRVLLTPANRRVRPTPSSSQWNLFQSPAPMKSEAPNETSLRKHCKNKDSASATNPSSVNEPFELIVVNQSFENKEKNYKMAVVLEGFPDNKLSEEAVEQIGSQLMDCIQTLDNGLGPQMEDWRCEDGALLVTCVNGSTKEWLEDCVNAIETVNGMALKVGEADEILDGSFKVRTCFQLNSKGKEMDTLLRIMAIQNPGLNTSGWKVVSTNLEDSRKTAVLRLHKEDLETLRQREFKLYCGLEQISFTLLE